MAIHEVGGSANAPCPVCGVPVTFFSGEENAFISEVEIFSSDSPVELKCKQHGAFEVRAGNLRDKLD